MTAAPSGFADLPADARAAAMDAAQERYGVENFFDLDPQQRRDVYDQAATDYWDRRAGDRS